MDTKFNELLKNFLVEGQLIELKANKEGHINSTFISTFKNGNDIKKYTHQKINQLAFHEPEKVMENITKITSHIQKKIQNCQNPNKRCLKVIRTQEGKPFFKDENGDYWRTYEFIDEVKTYSKISDKHQAFLLGKAIANFQKQLQDFDGTSLHETIVDFHNMRFRYDNLEKAVKKDVKGRVKEVQAELNFLLENKERGFILWDEMKDKKLPVRVTHNDTKINNVLFSKDGSEALCVIDLDTVMPGTILFDTGDMIRTATSTLEEDALNYQDMQCNVDYYHSLIEGYRSLADSFLTKREKELIIESGRNITQIMAVRFLTDYLSGDIYYSISREKHNLDRTRTQIALIKDFDKKWQELLTCLN